MAGSNFFADALAPADAATILEQLDQSTAMMKAVQLRGSAARWRSRTTPPPSPTATPPGVVNIAAMYVDSAEADTHNSWVAALADSLGKGEAGGYVGFLGEEDEGTVALPTQARHGTGSAS